MDKPELDLDLDSDLEDESFVKLGISHDDLEHIDMGIKDASPHYYHKKQKCFYSESRGKWYKTPNAYQNSLLKHIGILDSESSDSECDSEPDSDSDSDSNFVKYKKKESRYGSLQAIGFEHDDLDGSSVVFEDGSAYYCHKSGIQVVGKTIKGGTWFKPPKSTQAKILKQNKKGKKIKN